MNEFIKLKHTKYQMNYVNLYEICMKVKAELFYDYKIRFP